MPSWANTQRSFLAAMQGEATDLAAPERLAIYRDNVAHTLADALGETYRAIKLLVGEAFFAALAHEYAQRYAPKSGNLNDYGDAFAAFIAQHAACGALPYLPDVARFEWAWQRCYYAPALQADPALARLVEAGAAEEMLASQVTFCASLQLLECSYDVEPIWRFCVLDEGRTAPPSLQQSKAHYALYRSDNQVACLRLDADEQAHALRLLMQGKTLHEALSEMPAESIDAFMTLLFSRGWVMALTTKEAYE